MDTISSTPLSAAPAAAPFSATTLSSGLVLSIKDAHQLSQSYSTTWKKRADKRPISSKPVIAKLDVEYNELAQSWEAFQDGLSPQDRVQFQERCQAASDVLRVVQAAKGSWLSSSRHRHFANSSLLADRFLDSLDAHESLLGALPGREAYLSLFHGVLQSTIQASSNYPRVLDGLLRALIEINEAARLPCALLAQSSINCDALFSIAEFYSAVFFFFEEFMNWYIRSSYCQLLQSHLHDVYSDSTHLICNIRSQARQIRLRLANSSDLDDQDHIYNHKVERETAALYFWKEARLNQIGLQGRDRKFASENAITRRIIWEIQQDAAERRRLMTHRDRILSGLSTSFCKKATMVDRQSGSAKGVISISMAAPEAQQGLQYLGQALAHGQSSEKKLLMKELVKSEYAQGSKRKLNRTALQIASKHLQSYFDADDVEDFNSADDVAVDSSALISLQEWLTSPRSCAVALKQTQLQPLSSPAGLNPFTPVSNLYVTLARQDRLPVISYFCARTKSKSSQSDDNSFERRLIALAYSIIRQLIDLLPPILDIDAGCMLSAESIRKLDGTFQSWKEVLSFIDLLLRFAPPLLICVVDGLDAIGDASTEVHLRSLLDIILTHTRLHAAVDSDGKPLGNLIKVLITTSGQLHSQESSLEESSSTPI